jgi:hypothetical protein
VAARKVGEVSGVAYMALRNTLDIQLNYPSEHGCAQLPLKGATNISLSIEACKWLRSSIHLAKLPYPPPTGGRIARLTPSLKVVSRPCIKVMLRPSIKNCKCPFGSFDPRSNM